MSAADARRDLAAVIKLLRRAYISQNGVARDAGYSAGYVTQLLSDKYPIERLTDATISRLVKSVNGRARSARGVLRPDEVEELDRLLERLTSTYVRAMAEVYGMSGGRLDEREAAQYRDSEVDRVLRETIDRHGSYGFVSVTGAPGTGKTWALANLARDATMTHEVVWADFEGLEREDDSSRPAHLQVGRELRLAQQNYYSVLEHALGLPPDLRTATGERLSAAAVTDAVDAGLRSLDGVSPKRVEATSASLARRLDDRRLAGLASQGTTRRYLDEVRDTLDVEYGERQLGDDLALLWALADAATLTESSAAHAEPRKLLVLVDSPDLNGDIASLIQMLRTVATLRRFCPECRNVLVVLGKTVRVRASPLRKSTSTMVNLGVVTPFSSDDVRALLAVLREHGWFRDEAFDDERARESLVENCRVLCGFNRRVSCMYLEHCHRMSRLIAPPEYLAASGAANDQLRRWIDAWAQRAVLALAPRPELRELVRDWLDDLPQDALDETALRELADDFGLIVDADGLPWPPPGTPAIVPLLQRAVCDRMRALLEQQAVDATERMAGGPQS